jgi:hypothetical protein
VGLGPLHPYLHLIISAPRRRDDVSFGNQRRTTDCPFFLKRMALFSYGSLCAQRAAWWQGSRTSLPPRTVVRRFDCHSMAVHDAAVQRTRMIGATRSRPLQVAPGLRSRPHGLNASLWGRGKLPDYPGGAVTLVRSKVLPFLDCKDVCKVWK